MSIFDNLKAGIQQHLDKKKEEKEFIERLQLEAKVHRQQAFADEFRKNSRQVAIAHAKKDAASKSGLQKLRSLNRVRNLSQSDQGKSSFFQNFSEYTQRNLANRERNLKATEELRKAGKQMREKKLLEQRQMRDQRIVQPKLDGGFGTKRV